MPPRSFGLLHEVDLEKPVGRLSVGQRRRLAPALLVARPPQLLLLDEPTNHLSPPSVTNWRPRSARAPVRSSSQATTGGSADADPGLQAGALLRPVRVHGGDLLRSRGPFAVATAVGQQAPDSGRRAQDQPAVPGHTDHAPSAGAGGHEHAVRREAPPRLLRVLLDISRAVHLRHPQQWAEVIEERYSMMSKRFFSHGLSATPRRLSTGAERRSRARCSMRARASNWTFGYARVVVSTQWPKMLDI